MRNLVLHFTAAIACATLLAACADRVPTMPRSSTTLEPSFSVSAPAVTSLGSLHGQAVNDAGVIVGAKGPDVYLWRPTLGEERVAAGVPWDISGDGKGVSGRNSSERPVLWSHDGSGWTETLLPHLGAGGAARAMASDASGAPAVMTGNVWGADGYSRNPAVWTRCVINQVDCPVGWRLTILPAPNAATWGQDVNGSGQVVGMDGTGCCLAVFWETGENGTFQLLPPLKAGEAAAAWSINDAGTVIVGNSAGRAVAWVRSPATGTFERPIALPSRTSGCGASGAVAYAVAPDLTTTGTIVGQDCGAPVAWQVTISGDQLSAQRIALPSAVKSTKGTAQGINRSTSAYYGATGQAGGTGVFWAFKE